MKLAIGIPTLNRLDLLLPSLKLYLKDFPNTSIIVLDNGKQNIDSKIQHPNLLVVETEKNIGVAASWNVLCDLIYKNHDYALILNDDVYLGLLEPMVIKFIESNKKDFYVASQDWCAFILPKNTFNDVGKFDENFFPAYFEDNDYHYRMRLIQKSFHKTPILNPIVYRASCTISRNSKLNDGFHNLKEFYIKKWGGEPTKEIFKTPFNK